MQNKKLQRLVRMGMLGGLAFLLVLFEVHVPPFAEFLKYDPGDIPAMIATFAMGPVSGLAVEGIKALLFLISGKSTAGWVGVLANFLTGVALVLAAGMVRKLLARSGTKDWVANLIAAVAGTLIMAAVLIPVMAGIIYPLWNMKGAAAWSAAVYISAPFNLFKGFLSSMLSLAFYRRLEPFLADKSVHKTA